MNRLAVSGILLLSCLLCLAQTPEQAPAQTADKSAAKASERCVLAGTIVNSNTNVGIAHALVSYTGPAAGFRFTDAGGTFRAGDLPAGDYVVTVSKPGFISAQELSSRNDPSIQAAQPGIFPAPETNQLAGPPMSTTIEIELSAESEPAQIKLLPLSSIAGIVLDENSEPLAGVSVQAVEVRPTLNGPDYAPAQTANTDDRGAYQFFDLIPGSYIVRLVGEASSTDYYEGKFDPKNDHRGLRPVYYPSGDSAAAASVFRLAPGEQRSADFQQPTEPAFDIDGRLSNFVPQPRALATIQMFREGDPLPVARAHVNLSNGEFHITDVPPGAYTLRASQVQLDPLQWSAAETPVTVSSQPIRNLQVELARGSRLPVSVSYEAGAQPGGRISLVLQPLHNRTNLRPLVLGTLAASMGLGSARTTPDGNPGQAPPSAFADVLPDRYRFSATPFGTDYVASATLGQQDILQHEFSLGSGASGEIHLVIRGDSASVEGQVTSQGRPAPGATIILVAAGTSVPKLGVGDAMGHYQIAAVPPGEYRIAAWTAPPSASDLSSANGQSLTLQPGEHRTMTIEAVANGAPPQDEPQGLQ